MNDEQSQQLQKVQERAEFLLRQGHARTQPHTYPLFQVATLPSFEPTVVWEVCEKKVMSENDYLVEGYVAVRSQWREDVDLEQLEQRETLLPIKRKTLPPLEPTIEVRCFDLPSEWCQSMMERLQGIQIPIYDEGVMRDKTGQMLVGLDGTSYELAFAPGDLSARFHWWEKPTAAWSPLDAFVRDVLKKLERL